MTREQLEAIMHNLDTVCPIKGAWIMLAGIALIWVGMGMMMYVEKRKKRAVSDVLFRCCAVCTLVGILVGGFGLAVAQRSLYARENISRMVECKEAEMYVQDLGLAVRKGEISNISELLGQDFEWGMLKAKPANIKG